VQLGTAVHHAGPRLALDLGHPADLVASGFAVQLGFARQLAVAAQIVVHGGHLLSVF
jgi:hypothetical protein